MVPGADVLTPALAWIAPPPEVPLPLIVIAFATVMAA